jgi:hypothetical protein
MDPAISPTSPPPPTEPVPTEPAASPTEPAISPTNPPPAPSPTEAAISPTNPPPPTEPPVELQACDADSECVSGECALDSYAPSVGTRKKVCCPSGDSTYLSSPDSAYFCTSIIPNGERCKGNSLCQSGICLDDGRCAAEGKPNGSSCAENGDCQSLVCLQLNNTCSASRISDAENCGTDDDCLKGECALDSYAPSVGTRKKVCCPSGDSTYLSSPDSAYFCTSIIPNGERCKGNSLCQSGICLDDGTCAAEGKANGLNCVENGDCASLICLQLNSTCSAGRIPNAESCGANDDCLNGECALDSFAPSVGTRKKVCCPSGDSTYLSSPDSAYFCTSNIPNGERCRGNSLCQSGICLDDGTCAAEGKANGLSCIENGDCQSLVCLELNKTCSASRISDSESCAADRDCLNDSCGFDSYAPSTGARKKVCCPSRTTVYLSSPDSAYFCTSIIPNGGQCPNTSSGNRLCQSGLCLEGTCAAQKGS